MEVWILFICGINMDTLKVTCNTGESQSEPVCLMEEARIRSLPNAPIAAVCFSVTRDPVTEST